ncbi:MAG: FMN reductase (NADPH) [Candidatus Heimdallarchaeota archaeon LC_3]|nr:MAG: FMN reductase (NADPH) [Candidatus Heimdallarchaeota archaeon LC_3]
MNLSTSETIDLMLNHRSIRKFDPEYVIPRESIDLIVKAGQKASTSGSLQMFTLIEISKSKRQEEETICGTQQFIKDASYFGILFADFYRLKRMLELSGGSYKNYPALSLTMGPLDAGLMIQNMALAAESLGYGMVFCGACGDYGQRIFPELEVPREVIPLTGIAIGKPLERSESKPRLPTKLIHHCDKYFNYSDEDLKAGLDFMSKELSRINNREVSWGDTLVKRFNGGWAENRDKKRRNYLIEQNFKF